MTAAADSVVSRGPAAAPAAESRARFVLLGGDARLAAAVQSALTKPLGFEPDAFAVERAGDAAEALRGAEGEAFLLPMSLEFGLFEKESLSQTIAGLRRTAPALTAHYDDVRLGDPLLVEAFAESAVRACGAKPFRPERTGVLLTAAGEGDPASRAEIYALMRNVWERLGVKRGEVAFLRHTTPFLRDELERVAREPLEWIVVPAMLTSGERCEHLKLILDDHRRNSLDSAAGFLLAEPPADHAAVVHWAARRALDLWRSKRRDQAARKRSPMRETRGAPVRKGARIADGVVGDARDALELRALLPEEVLDASTVFVKVTWHGYAPGCYTDPVALDALLDAIPGRVVLLEGHTSSRNDAGRVEWDWETEARERRAWIRAQELEYLDRIGVSEVIRNRRATYVNVTEEYWDGRCADADRLEKDPDHPELAGYVPELILEHRGAPLLSYARFKGPTRLSLANLFGLIPEPLRARWHGPNITHLAKVCCAIARTYDSILDVYGMAESINGAVRWDRRGLYRSRWGNYDLLPAPGLAAISRGVAGADTLAARLQGQDPRRSAYYAVVDKELGIPEPALDLDLPVEWTQRFA